MAFVHPTRTIVEDLLPNTLGFGNDPGPNRLVVITIASQVRTTLYVADRRVSAWRTRRISRLLTLGRVDSSPPVRIPDTITRHRRATTRTDKGRFQRT